MSDARHTFETLARHLIRATLPIVDAAASPAAFQSLIARLGFRVTTVPAPFAALSVSVGGANVKVDGFALGASLNDIRALLGDAKAVYDGIRGLALSPPPGVDALAWKAEIGDGMFALLLSDYLAREFPTAFGVLNSFGAIRFESISGSATRPAFVRPTLNLPALVAMISDPGGWPGRVWGWGTPKFDGNLVLEHLLSFAYGLGFQVSLPEQDGAELAGYLGHAAPLNLPSALRVPFIGTHFGDVPVLATIDLRPLAGDGATLPGIVLEPRLPAELPLTLKLHPKVSMRLLAGTNTSGLFGIAMRPNDVAVRFPLAPATAPPPGGIGIGFDFTPTTRTLLIGDPKASRLECAGATLDLKATFVNNTWSVNVGVDLKGVKFVFDPGEGDGFLRFLIGSTKTEIGIPVGLQWGRDGLRFGGSASFNVVVHPHLSIGPAKVEEIDVGLKVPVGGKPRVQLEVGAAISTEIGPVSMMLKGVGLRADVRFEPGNAGPLDIDVGFKPPSGVRVTVEGGGFKGGGFLDFEPDRGEYSGTLELTFAEFISVRAVGILSTRLPDGRDSFSLLLIIVSEFIPIQLSFGFTLIGVGGLLGLNRTVELDVLQVGVRDGTLNSILFPTDVAANAPRIISDLKRVFPPHEDRFLIGPMGKLGWGTPAIISLEIGLLLEIPRPAFAILGVLRIQLPAEEFGVLYLQVNFVGSVDFEKGQLQFDASLYNSRIMIFPLTGDMAVRVYWGGDANFLLTVGGFHPAYTPPPMNIGTLSRLGITIAGGMPSVRAEAYFAVTSNTVQFGARVEIIYGVKFFNVYGMISLDVLIQFNPFKFIAEIAAMFAVRSGTDVLFAIQVKGTLEGPTPWHVRGEASFRIGFIVKVKLSANFEVTIGEARKAMLPAMDALAEIRKALDAIGNWRAVLPRASNQHVSLRELPNAGALLVVHPFGSLEISQKVAPLNIPIQRIGASRPDRGSVFRIAAAQLNGADTPTVPSPEQFAPAQFFEMSDAEKLSRPSFARYDAGVVIGADTAPQTDFRRSREVQYEVVYLPEHHPIRLLFKLAVGLFEAFARGASVASSALSQARRAPSAVAAAPVSYAPEQYAVVSTMDLTLHAAPMVYSSATAADVAVAQLIAAQPELHSAVQVVPASQVRRAA